MEMKHIFLSLVLCGCSPTKKDVVLSEPFAPPSPPPNMLPPNPPPNIRPPSPPPNFIPNISDVAEVQINPIPHPFNLNGSIPYAVWVNGERLPLNSIEIRALAKSLNLNFEQPKNTAKIHNGEGWLFPLKINNGSESSNNRKYEQEKAFTE